MNTGFVYIHTNRENGKKYVGQTKGKLERRWRKDGGGYKLNPDLYADIQTYGWSNFDHEVIELPHCLLDFFESHYIQHYNTMDPTKGYNRDFGGVRSKHLSSETKHKISIARMGMRPSEETRKKMSEAQAGRVFSVEHRQKLSKAFSRPVAQLTIDGHIVNEFPSRTKATEQTGVNGSHISDCCNGKRKSAGGFVWRYKEAE